MRAMELHALSLLDALRALREGQITVTDLIESCSRRIAALDPEIHAWEWFEPSRAEIERALPPLTPPAGKPASEAP